MAGEVYSLLPMWKYWTPKTQMSANDLDHALSAPRQLAGRPIKSQPVLRLLALGALNHGAFLKQTICVASDCLQLRNQTVLNPPHLVTGASVFFCFFCLPLIFCYFHTSAICSCDKVKRGLQHWPKAFLPLSCSFLPLALTFASWNILRKGNYDNYTLWFDCQLFTCLVQNVSFCFVSYDYENPNDTDLTLGNGHDLKIRVWCCRILE